MCVCVCVDLVQNGALEPPTVEQIKSEKSAAKVRCVCVCVCVRVCVRTHPGRCVCVCVCVCVDKASFVVFDSAAGK